MEVVYQRKEAVSETWVSRPRCGWDPTHDALSRVRLEWRVATLAFVSVIDVFRFMRTPERRV